MKRTYIQPTTCSVSTASIRLLAGSTDKEHNKVTPGGGGVNTGGNSQEGSGTDTDGDGSVDDMAKFNPWTTWDEE